MCNESANEHLGAIWNRHFVKKKIVGPRMIHTGIIENSDLRDRTYTISLKKKDFVRIYVSKEKRATDLLHFLRLS